MQAYTAIYQDQNESHNQSTTSNFAMAENHIESAKVAALGVVVNMRSWNEEFYNADPATFKVPENQADYAPRVLFLQFCVK